MFLNTADGSAPDRRMLLRSRFCTEDMADHVEGTVPLMSGLEWRDKAG